MKILTTHAVEFFRYAETKMHDACKQIEAMPKPKGWFGVSKGVSGALAVAQKTYHTVHYDRMHAEYCAMNNIETYELDYKLIPTFIDWYAAKTLAEMPTQGVIH